jgi:hypothetical protein
MVAGKPTENDLKEICGYVEQFDTLVGELTVGQMMAYTAELKLPVCCCCYCCCYCYWLDVHWRLTIRAHVPGRRAPHRLSAMRVARR